MDRDGGVDVHAGEKRCRCGVLDFESNGPPTGTCTLAFDKDGAARLVSVQGEPAFSARLTATGKRRPGERAYYAFEGAFDFKCKKAWCGNHSLSVLELGDLDYRVTVARSADGPPSHVLWLTCEK